MYKRNLYLNKIIFLERKKPFINKYFLGETAAKITLKKWNKKMTYAIVQLKRYECFIQRKLKNDYIIGVAQENIETGDFVSIDNTTGKIRKSITSDKHL